MLVFVDESGDTGLKIGAGSSERFTLTLVIFHSHDEARRTEDRISALRRELRKPTGFEFHFKENTDDIRESFLRAVSPFAFSYFAFVIDKAAFYRAGLSPRNTAYADICGLVFDAARDHLQEALVKVDRNGGKEFRRELAAFLKRKVNDPALPAKHIKRVEMPTSHGNDLLQLADMICGAIARSYQSGKKAPDRFRKIIAHREISVRFLPEE